MTSFLFSMQPTNDLGLLAQSLPIARELRNREHRVAFCQLAKAPEKVIFENGFDSINPVCPVYRILTGDTRLPVFLKMLVSGHLKRDSDIISWYVRHLRENSTSEIWNIDHFAYVMGMSNERYSLAVTEALSKLIIKHKPDVIVNFWNPFMSIAAKMNRVPLVSVIQADLHPQSKGFIWWKESPANLPTPVSSINKILSEKRLPGIDAMGDLLLGDLTIVVGTREIEPLPGAVDLHYIGPLLMQKQSETLPEWVADLRDDQPVIWIYPGNLQYIKGSDSPFDGIIILKACIEALKNAAVQVIVSTGHQTLPAEVLPLPSNFRFISFVPGLAMAKRSDLMIHHGGYGSCQTGLFAGTPAVIIPTYSERESNARRIASVGAGEYILPSMDSSGKKKALDINELREKIGRVLSEPSYREAAVRINEQIKWYGGASEAANLIEEFLRDNSIV